MIFVNRIIKTILVDTLTKSMDKNFFLGKKLENILNSMKYSVCSIDLNQNEIYFNSSFYNFMNNNFRNRVFGTIHLFCSESNYSNLSNLYLNFMRNLKSDEKSFLDQFYDKDDTKQKKFQPFIVKILILNRIFDKFKLKNKSTPSTLNLLKFFKEKNSFLTENCIIKKEEYRMDSGFSEKIIEISWKKSFYNDNQENYQNLMIPFETYENNENLKIIIYHIENYQI